MNMTNGGVLSGTSETACVPDPAKAVTAGPQAHLPVDSFTDLAIPLDSVNISLLKEIIYIAIY